MSAVQNKLMDHYKNGATSRRSSRNAKVVPDETDPVQDEKMKVTSEAEVPPSLESDPTTQDEPPDSHYEVILISDFDLGEEIHVEGTTDDQDTAEDPTSHPELKTAMTEETGPTSQGRKIITLKKPFSSRASEKAQSLILDCIVSLPDQEQLESLRLSSRQDPLRQDEWRRVISVLIELLHVHFNDNDEHDIDYATLTATRLALKEAYSWAGYVDHDFQPTGYLKSLSADGCYSLMRRKNNSKKGNQKKAMLKRKSVPSVSSKKIKRIILSGDERLNYKMFCEKLSSIPNGEVLDEDLVQEAQYHVSCFTQDMKSAKGTDYEDLQKSKVLDFVRHFQVYHAVVESMAKRKDVFGDFELQCAMYLHCLDDLMSQFPPSEKNGVLSLDVEGSPYISLGTIVGLQLGTGAKFLLELSDMNEECVSSCGPVFIVRHDDAYDVWLQTLLIAGSLTESQALFVLATAHDVLDLPQNKNENYANYYNLIDFLRKFLLNLPDFVTKQKDVLALGHAFFHYSYRAVLKLADNVPISVTDGARCAQLAVSDI